MNFLCYATKERPKEIATRITKLEINSVMRRIKGPSKVKDKTPKVKANEIRAETS
jgi:hypothetical protein